MKEEIRCPVCRVPLHMIVSEGTICFCPVCSANLVREGDKFVFTGKGAYDWVGRGIKIPFKKPF